MDLKATKCYELLKGDAQTEEAVLINKAKRVQLKINNMLCNAETSKLDSELSLKRLDLEDSKYLETYLTLRAEVIKAENTIKELTELRKNLFGE